MHVKVSMRRLERDLLSEHEVKRCSAVARGLHWDVWEEDLLWWSPDRVRWQPLDAQVLSRQRRWLMLDTEEGPRAALIWHTGEIQAAPAPQPAAQQPPVEQPAFVRPAQR